MSVCNLLGVLSAHGRFLHRGGCGGMWHRLAGSNHFKSLMTKSLDGRDGDVSFQGPKRLL